MERYNKFLYGFLIGLILPPLFIWVYLWRLYPIHQSVFLTLKQLYPSAILGKLLLLSVMPNLGGVFVFYKSDSFKIATGVMIGAMPYFIGCILML